jgi:predicted NUDIX family NTP pyrophosphohydrolase
MARIAAGLLLYRMQNGGLEVLLAHPGGPFFSNKDGGSWTVPKGEPDDGEELLDTARREFAEETGFKPCGPFVPLRPIQQKGGKIVHCWAVAGDCDPTKLHSNTCTIEWPPKSGRQIEIPETDRFAFFDLATAKRKIREAQVPLVEELAELIASDNSQADR